MKSRRTTILIIIVTVIIIVVRLTSNKRSFDKQLKMITEFNTRVPVITDTVKYNQIPAAFSINGSFQALHEISITSEIQGKINSIASATGDNVRAGQILASIENELFASQLELAKFNLEKAEKDMQRFDQLSKGEAVTLQQFESAKQTYMNARSACTAAKVQYESTNIKAPFDGIITRQYIEKGSYLSPGMPVFDLVEIKNVKFIGKLTSAEVEKVHKGQHVKIGVDNYPGINYEGKINSMVVKTDLSKRYDVEIEVVNKADYLIKPGMFGTGIFEDYRGEKVLTIPRKAIGGSIKSPEVYLVKGDSVVSRSITASPVDDKNIQVTQGLNAGDVIVVAGQINLVNGSKISFNK